MRLQVLIITAALVGPSSCSDGRRSTPTAPPEVITANSPAEDSQSRLSRRRVVRSESSGLIGRWGGEHIGLDLKGTSGQVELDCAHGSIDEPIVPGADGTFDVRGTFVLERGGPIDPGAENRRPARYRGKISGERMDLTLSVDEMTETFTLVMNQPPHIVKCL